MVAWIGMFAVNSREGSLSSALEKTFDGKHPCPLCEAVESGRDQERNDVLVDSSNKVNAVLFVESTLPPVPSSDLVFFAGTAIPDSVTFAPRSRPPWRA